MNDLEDRESSQQIDFQREFYLHLLSIDGYVDPDDYLKKALRLLASMTHADQGYIELRDREGKILWTSFSFTDQEVENIQSVISQGIIRETLDKKQMVQTSSAITDPRFKERKSVQDARLKAVVCIPLPTEKSSGILYLQGKGTFQTEIDRMLGDALIFSRHISPILDQVFVNQYHSSTEDFTQELRKQYSLDKTIGKSQALAKILKEALLVAPLNVSILLSGKSGTGKTQLARIVHENSFRANKSFVELNCASIPETLLENELFGSEIGGHSTATRPIQGKVSVAEGGTLFLDEISELPLSAQAKLLQLLESGSYFPLGSARSVKADVRIITASNIDLGEATARGNFREDLYYRIKIFTLYMPELSEREGDIEELIAFFSHQICIKHGLNKISISPAAYGLLLNRTWKGNIRELKHTLEAALIRASLNGRDELLQEDCVTDDNDINSGRTMTKSYKEATLRFQKQFLVERLEENEWNVLKTAKTISISRSQLNNLIKQFNLQRHQAEIKYTP